MQVPVADRVQQSPHADASAPWTLVVAIPAHDEAALLGDCLAAVRVAAARLRGAARTHVVVAADACSDDTEEVARAELAALCGSVVRLAARNAGIARAAAVADGIRRAGPVRRDRLWIAMTDADSSVPATWLTRHLQAAQDGDDALVGAIAVTDWTARDAPLDGALRRLHRQQRRAGVRPVHGANLGVSADALATVGGVPPHPVGEDVALVRRIESAGMSVRWDAELVVETSARRSHRAPGGFSSLLDQLETQRRAPTTASRCA